MKKFQFRMEKLKKLRSEDKQRAQKLFAEALKRELLERKKLKSLQLELRLRRKAEIDNRKKKIDTVKARLGIDYLRQLEFLISYQSEQVNLAETNTSELRFKLEQASKELKKFERLEEIQTEEYKRNIDMLYQKETDEIGTQIYIRQD